MWVKPKQLLYYFTVQYLLSTLAGWLAESRWRWLKKMLIRYFVNHYPVNVELAQVTDLDAYPNFNSFFIRLLKPELRPIVSLANEIASPVDGQISQVGRIAHESLLQAKGSYFTLSKLLGGCHLEAARFYDGEFATIYLAPHDYHRIHMPIQGQLRKTIYIPGRLFSVNQANAETIPNLFARNERLVCLFETEIGSMAVILVGAMLVSSITTVWGSVCNTRTIDTQLYPQGICLSRGTELGHFNMGSTVILLFEKNKIRWATHFKEKSLLNMGQLIGNLITAAAT